jgi:hypothetical protein
MLQRPRPASTLDSLARSRVGVRPAGQTARQRDRRPTGRQGVATRAPMSQNVIKTVSFFNNNGEGFKIFFIILVLKRFQNSRATAYLRGFVRQNKVTTFEIPNKKLGFFAHNFIK